MFFLRNQDTRQFWLVSILRKFSLHHGGSKKSSEWFVCGVWLVPSLSSLFLACLPTCGNNVFVERQREGSQVVQWIEYLHDHKLFTDLNYLRRTNVDSFFLLIYQLAWPFYLVHSLPPLLFTYPQAIITFVAAATAMHAPPCLSRNVEWEREQKNGTIGDFHH